MNDNSRRPELFVESSDAATPFSLSENNRVVIGRNRSADLPLNDLGISRQHCAVTTTDDGVFMEDLGSASGTFVNGQRIAGKLKLQNGDKIRVGNVQLRFRHPGAKSNEARIDVDVAPNPDRTMAGRVADIPPRRESEPSPPIPLRERTLIGRDARCDVPLTGRDISRQHAEIRRENGLLTVRDLASTNGTFVNGQEVSGRTPLNEGSRLRIGSYVFIVREGKLWPSCQKGNVRVSLESLVQTVVNRETSGTLKLLDGISLVIEPNEFVALLGPSGSGKSTLMDAMNGRRPASSGRVLINGEDFYAAYQYYRRAIGHVPQKDIVHMALTVEQALTFAARLRLPSDTSEEEIQRIVLEVIDKTGLSERRGIVIGNLSGGQLKRVSLGVELIADPSLLFLDEATSGLDAGTEARMMGLFRAIADEGKTVVCITHNVENVSLCDLVVVLAQGKVAYYGPPSDLPGFFGVSKISEIYDRLECQSAEAWEQTFKASPFHERYVSARFKRTVADREQSAARAKPPPPHETFDEKMRQMRVLIHRYATVLLQDRKNVIILLVQAPLIGLLLGMVFGDLNSSFLNQGQEKTVVFLMSISAIWFGCINASREIVKELPIYLRERAVNLDIFSYLGSKVFVLSVLCVVQCVALYIVVAVITGLKANMIGHLATLTLTAWCGMVMGLLISALVDNADKAVAVIPLLLIPQVIFANVLTDLIGIPLTIGYCCPSFWSVDAMMSSLASAPSTRVVWAGNIFALLVLILIFAPTAAWALNRKDKLGR